MAFPPFREDRLNSDFCAVDVYSSPAQEPRVNGICYFIFFASFNWQQIGFFKDANILSCDSYLGITMYIASAVGFVYMVLGYFYMVFSMIHIVVKEFKTSKWVDVLDKLIRIRDEEYKDYLVRADSLPSLFPLNSFIVMRWAVF